MFSAVGIIQMLFILVILYFILGAIVLKFNISSVKVMLLGIAIIVFSNSVLKGMIKYGIDDLISIAGLSLCIVVFLREINYITTNRYYYLVNSLLNSFLYILSNFLKPFVNA